MNRLPFIGLAILLLASYAVAGVVTFTPEVQVVDPDVDTTATFTLGTWERDWPRLTPSIWRWWRRS